MNGDTGTGTSLPPWIIVVHRDEDRLFRQLSLAFESDPRVTVIKDRRRAGRRGRKLPVAAERRKSERRTPPAVQDEILWQSLRFRLIHRDADIKVYQVREAPTARPAKKAPKRRPTAARAVARRAARKVKATRPPRHPRRRRRRR